MTIGDKIRLLREARGLSQEELAKMLGYTSRSTINKIELNINEISYTKILQFAHVLEVDPAELINSQPIDMNAKIEQWDHLLNVQAISDESKLFDDIQSVFGHKSVKLLNVFNLLNNPGQNKAIEAVDDLSHIEKYRKEEADKL